MSDKTPLTPAQKNARVARRLVLLTGGMVGAAFAAAGPDYRPVAAPGQRSNNTSDALCRLLTVT